jgi:outer membrane protein
MVSLKTRILSFTLFFTIPLTYGQNTRSLTYEESISIALKESYTIKSFEANEQSMRYYYFYYKAMFKPKLDLSLFAPNWNENIIAIQRPDSLPVYNSYGSMMLGGDLQFTYMLPTGGNLALHSLIYRNNINTVLSDQDYINLKNRQTYNMLEISFNQPIFTKNALRENLKEAEYRYQQSSSVYTRGQMDIVYNVSEGFYSLYRATKIVEISNDKLANSEEAYRIAKLKSETGRIPEADVLTAEVKAAQNKAELSESINKMEREKDRFKQLIGLNLDEDIKIITEIKFDTFSINLDTAIYEALHNRLEINEAEYDIKLQNIQVDRAKRERALKGYISGYYDLTGISTINSHSTGELFKSSYNNLLVRPPNRGITFTITYPICDWGRGSSKIKKELFNLQAKNLELENTKNEIIRQIRDIVRTVGETKKRLEINEKNQSLALKSYKISRLRFENGDITNQQLAIEQQTLSDVQLGYLDAFITYQLAIADLKRKTMWDFKNNRSYLVK